MSAKKRRRKSTATITPVVRATSTLRVRARAAVAYWLPVLAIFFVTRAALAEAYRIPSGSMEPTLLVGDWLFVNKLRFGPHIPFTSRSLPGYAQPKRSDVVVFVSPVQVPAIRITPDDSTPVLVKRIAGVGGDTILMRHGQLYVNGALAPLRNSAYLLPDSVADQPDPLLAWQHQLEVGGTRFGAPVAAPSVHEWGPLVVPQNSYFMIGDNRDNSVDSRYYGPVPRENLRGTPTFVYYAYDAQAGTPFIRAITEIRWSRLGTWIR